MSMKGGLHRITAAVAISAVCFIAFFFASLAGERGSSPSSPSGLHTNSEDQKVEPPSRVLGRAHVAEPDAPVVQPATARHDMLPAAAKDRSSLSYQDFFLDLARMHYGPLLLDAIFDRDAINAAVVSMKDSSDDQSVIPSDSRYSWDIFKLRQRPVSPECFRTPADILRLSKVLISVGIGRFYRDKQLALMYRQAESAGNLALFTRQVRKVMTAYASYFHTMMQLAIDTMEGAVKDELHHLQAKYPSADPLTVIMTLVTHRMSSAGLEKLLQKPESTVAKQVEAMGYDKPQQAGPRAAGSIGPMFPLEYHMGHFDSQRPINGKFWNMIRPTASCSSLVRLCEVPDGCRLLCNAEYLMEAGLSRGEGKHHHRIAGFGSNNEYDWEMSLNRMFQKSTALSRGAHHEIGWVTVFDCTLGSGRRAWAPPKELTDSPIGFGHVTKCCDAMPSDKSVTLGITKALLLKSEQERIATKPATGDGFRTVGDLVTRYRVSDGSLSQAAKSAGDTNSLRTFDDLTILKLDIEGYEFNVLPKWARDELHCLAQHRLTAFAGGANDLIDFAVDCQDYFTVSLLSMEFHRSGHKGDYGARLPGALRAHYTVLHAYSLGYVMVGQERNHQDNCCYEVAWAHQRHFVRSEMWMLLGDGQSPQAVRGKEESE
jgi:hypothetical protein